MDSANTLKEVIEILHERLTIHLLDVISKSKLPHQQRQPLRGEVYQADNDFPSILNFIVRDHGDGLLMSNECTPQLRRLSQRIILNEICAKTDTSCERTVFHDAVYNHHIELLAKLTEVIGESFIAQSIRTKINRSTNDAQDCTTFKEQGNAFFKQGNYTEAMDLYTRAIGLSPSNPTLYANRALCEINIKEFQLARDDAEDAIELDCSNVKYFRILSEAFLALDLLNEAKMACQTGLQLQPSDSILTQRAHLIAEMNRATSDKQNFELIPPDEDIFDITDMDIYQHIQDLQEKIDQLNETDTLENFTAMIELVKQQAKLGSAEALCKMGLFFDSAGRLDGTKYFFEQAAAQRPYIRVNGTVMVNKGVEIAENNLGVMYLKGKGVPIDMDKAIEYCRRSAEHGYLEANQNVGFALLNSGNDYQTLKLARLSFIKAADLGMAAAQWGYANMLIC